MSARKRQGLFVGGSELQRIVGLTRWTAGRLALKGEIGFILGNDGAPRFSVTDARRVAAARETRGRRADAAKWSRQAGGEGSDPRA